MIARILPVLFFSLMLVGCWDTGSNVGGPSGGNGGGGPRPPTDDSGGGGGDPDSPCVDCEILPEPPSAELLLRHTPRVLCPYRLYAETTAGEGFLEQALELGIDHQHEVPDALWSQFSISHAMYSGAVSAVPAGCDVHLAFAGDPEFPLRIYRPAEGGFEPVSLGTVEGLPSAIAALAGYTTGADGVPRLFVSSLTRNGFSIYRYADSQLTLEQVFDTRRHAYGFAFADIDADGWTDFHVATWQGNSDQYLFRNAAGQGFEPAPAELTGSGTFPIPVSPFAAAFVDVNGTALPDILVNAEGVSASEVIGHIGGTYTSVTDRAVVNDENASGLVIADFSGNGSFDWFVSGVTGPDDGRDWFFGTSGNRVYRHRGEFSFTDETDNLGLRESDWGWGACAADFRNTGRLDLFQETGYGYIPDDKRALFNASFLSIVDSTLAGYQSTQARLYLSDGSNPFQLRSNQFGIVSESRGRGVLCHDIDRDGAVDLIVAQNHGPPLVYRNQVSGMADRNYLGIRLHGAGFGDQGAGARIRASFNGIWQQRLMLAGGGYLGTPAMEAHFGLGAVADVDQLEVIWADGEVSRLDQVAGNQYLDIVHPALRYAQDDQAVQQLSTARSAVLGWLNANHAGLDIDALWLLAILPDHFRQSLIFDARSKYDLAVVSRKTQGSPDAAIYENFRRAFDVNQPWIDAIDDFSTDPRDMIQRALFCRERGIPASLHDQLSGPISSDGAMVGARFGFWLIRDAGCAVDVPVEDLSLLLLSQWNLANFPPLGRQSLYAGLWLALNLREDLMLDGTVQWLLSQQRQSGVWGDARQSGGQSEVALFWLLSILLDDHSSRPVMPR